MKTITFCLGFDKNVEEAVNTYVSLFDSVFGNSKILHTTRYTQKELEALKGPGVNAENMPGPAGTVKGIRFTLNGEEVLAFNGGAYFGKINESTSIYITCETQEQIDKLWAKLSEGGVEINCGWLTDKFGVSWQIMPSLVREITEGSDEAKTDRLNIALFEMKKINIEELRRISEGE